MSPAERTQWVGLGLAAAVAVAAVTLARKQWGDRKQREPGLPDVDARHFRRQDVRRLVGAAVMLALAVGIVVGARLEPGVPGRPSQLFIRVWLVVSLLVFLLLALALFDWLATRIYAHRHRQIIARERIDMLRDELRRRASPRNGRAPHPDDDHP